MRLVARVCVAFSLSLVSSLASRNIIPDGPQGPAGAILKVKLNKRIIEKLINYPGCTV